MLTNSRITQDTLIHEIGEWSRAQALAAHLRQHDGLGWVGGYLGPDNVDALVAIGKPWAAEMYPQATNNNVHHMVLVEELDDQWVAIKDPWEGSTYRMTREDFDFRWSGNGVVDNG